MGRLSPMVFGVVGVRVLLAGVAKAAGVVGPAAFGALGLRLGVIGLSVGALVADQVGRFRLWLGR